MLQEPNMSTELTVDFNNFVDQTDAFNIEFDLWRRMAAMVMTDMSFDCGWRGMDRNMNFSDFSGYYMEYSETEVSLWFNGVQEGSVVLNPDGTITVDGFDDIKESSMYKESFDLLECCGFLCRSEENTQKAIQEMSSGHEIIYGMSYNGVFIYGIDPKDISLKTQLNSIALEQGADKVRFTTPDKILEAFNDFRENRLQTGPEPVMPQLLRVFFDGRTAYSEFQKDIINGRSKAQITEDNGMAAKLIIEFNKLRDILDEAVGVPVAHRPFLYEDAAFPSAYFRSDSVIVCNNNGKNLGGVFTVINGQIGLYNDLPLGRAPSDVKVIFKSITDAVRRAERMILSSENIETARKEYINYRRVKNQGPSI